MDIEKQSQPTNDTADATRFVGSWSDIEGFWGERASWISFGPLYSLCDRCVNGNQQEQGRLTRKGFPSDSWKMPVIVVTNLLTWMLYMRLKAGWMVKVKEMYAGNIDCHVSVLRNKRPNNKRLQFLLFLAYKSDRLLQELTHKNAQHEKWLIPIVYPCCHSVFLTKK